MGPVELPIFRFSSNTGLFNTFVKYWNVNLYINAIKILAHSQIYLNIAGHTCTDIFSKKVKYITNTYFIQMLQNKNI